MNAFGKFLNRLFFPPKCVCCDTLLPPGFDVFCEECMTAYQNAKLTQCPVCLKRYGECSCSADFLRTHGIPRLYKVFGYRAGNGDAPENKLIFSLKNDNYAATYRFVAEEWEQTLSFHGVSTSGAIITYIPSSRRRLMMSGFDHGKMMAKALADRLEIASMSLLRCAPNTRKVMQKELVHEDRLARAGSLFLPQKRKELPKGSTVILVDDISTSGATMYSAVRVLRGMGAAHVICLVLGETISPRYKSAPGTNKKASTSRYK